MDSYLHDHYAGNQGDVLKHLVHIAILNALKNQTVNFIDTHAAAGVYELSQSPRADNGILQLLTKASQDSHDPPPLFLDYQQQLKKLNQQSGYENIVLYPGSAWLAASILNRRASLQLIERSPSVFDRLQTLVTARPNIHYFRGDGFQFSVEKLASNSNYLLIDPPYLQTSDYLNAAETLKKTALQSARTVAALWYPLNDSPQLQDLIKAFYGCGWDSVDRFEFHDRPTTSKRIAGCGMLVSNLPKAAKQQLDATLPWISQHLNVHHVRFNSHHR